MCSCPDTDIDPKFRLSHDSQIDLDTWKTSPNIEDCPECLGAMLEY